MTNQMQTLLAASKYIAISSGCKRPVKYQTDREIRTAELRPMPDSEKPGIIAHHILRAEDEILIPHRKLMDDLITNALMGENRLREICPPQARCEIIRNFPESLLNRLGPVFSQSALFDPKRKFKKQFDAWHKSFVWQLAQAERYTEKGSEYQSRLAGAYTEVFYASYPAIKELVEELKTLIGEIRGTTISIRH
jgi:hypothetical protein